MNTNHWTFLITGILVNLYIKIGISDIILFFIKSALNLMAGPEINHLIKGLIFSNLNPYYSKPKLSLFWPKNSTSILVFSKSKLSEALPNRRSIA